MDRDGIRFPPTKQAKICHVFNWRAFHVWPLVFSFSFDGPQPIDVFRLLLQYFQLAKNDRNC